MELKSADGHWLKLDINEEKYNSASLPQIKLHNEKFCGYKSLVNNTPVKLEIPGRYERIGVYCNLSITLKIETGKHNRCNRSDLGALMNSY